MMLPHKVWEGRNVFLCGAGLLGTPQSYSLTLSFPLFTTVYETFFLVPKYASSAARANGPGLIFCHAATSICWVPATLVDSLVFTFATIVVEPGIIPRPSFLQQPLCSVMTCTLPKSCILPTLQTSSTSTCQTLQGMRQLRGRV